MDWHKDHLGRFLESSPAASGTIYRIWLDDEYAGRNRVVLERRTIKEPRWGEIARWATLAQCRADAEDREV